jgi:hypothetical protein
MIKEQSSMKKEFKGVEGVIKTDLQETVQELLKEVKQEKKQVALEEFIRIYNSYPSYRNLVGSSEYFVKMNEKLTHAYNEALNVTRN